MRRIVRHIYHIGVILLFVLVAVAGFTQTKTFRSYLLSKLMEEVNGSVRGSVWVSSLDGNLFTGLRLRDIEIAEGGVEIARIAEVRVSYDLLGFVLGNVRLSDVEVIRPSMFLRRARDGRWNLDRFLPVPSDEGDEPAGSAAPITVRRIKVEEGWFRMVDSMALSSGIGSDMSMPTRAVDYGDIQITRLAVDAGVTLSQFGSRIEVHSLSFDLPRHDITLKDLKGTFEILKTSTRIENLRILTDRSALELDASLAKGLGQIGDLKDLAGASTRLVFKAQNIDLRELRQFLYPHVEFLDRSANIDLRVSGTFDRLSVDRLAVRTPASFIQMHGFVSNLHTPENLRLDVQGDESVARSDDIHSVLAGLTFPDWERFGDVTFQFSFNGVPDDFTARVSTLSERGSLDVDGHIIVGEFLRYKGTVRMEDFDIGGLVGDGRSVSAINGHVELDGSGTDITSLITTARMTIDSASIAEIGIRRSVLVVDAAGGSLSGHLEGMTDAGSLTLSGRSHLRSDGGIDAYQAQGSLRGLDISTLTGIRSYTSDLNFDFSAGGITEGSNDRDSIRLSFLASTFGKYPIEPSQVHLRQSQWMANREIAFESVPATLHLAGKFEPDQIPSIITYAYDVVRHHAERTFTELDPLRTLETQDASDGNPGRSIISPQEFDTSDIRISYEIRSLTPVAAIAVIDISGDASGTLDLVGTGTDFQVSGRLSSGYFDLQDESIRMAGKHTTLDFFADRLEHASGTVHTGTSVTLGSNALLVNGTLLSDVSVRTDIQDSTGMVSVQAFVDSTIQVTGIGALRRSDRFTEFTFDQLRVEVNAFSVQTMDSAVALLGSDGVLIQQATFGTDGERIRLGGLFNPVGVSDLRVELDNVRASHLSSILARTSAASTVAGLSGSIDATLLFRGSFDHPNMQLDLRTRDLALDLVRFGSLTATIGYFERLLSMDVSLDMKEGPQEGSPDLLLRGSVPYDFSLSGHAEEEELQGDVDLVMRSTGIDMSFFEPFLADVTRRLEGTLTCDIHMKGDVNDPRYEGMASITGGSMVFVPTRMRYQLDGNFVAEGDRIRLQNVTVRNTPEDYGEGRMNVGGTVSLAGISLQRFDLGFSGELRLMREDSSRMLGNPYYGDLTVATSGQPLKWIGTVDRSKVTGQMLLRNAAMTLPPDREARQYSTRLIDIIRDPDSSIIRARLALRTRDAEFIVRQPEDEEVQPSFVDRIDFDLTLETQGPTQIRFIFNSQANDVLFADLRGRLSFLRDPSSTRLIGDIEVTDRSYYNFLKRFSASGRMLFTGDPLNPELDIVARYQGIHKKAVGDVGATTAGGPAQTVDEQTTVILNLKGPRSQLQTSFDIELKDPKSTEGVRRLGDRGGNTDVEADAIAFVMTGQFRDELTEQQRTGLLGENLGYGLASGLLTGPLSETLRRTTQGSIQSLDVIYYGGGQFSQGADVRVTGQVGEAIYRVGGRVFDSIDNTNVIVEIPMSALLNSNDLRNLILTLERRVEGAEQLEDQRRSSNEARLQYRIRF